MVPVRRSPRFQQPELPEDQHRPVGAPRTREIKSQKAQIESGHRPGFRKDRKWGMEDKT